MIRLFTSYYEDKNPQRHKEVLECLNRNIANKFIDQVCLVTDGDEYEESESYRVIRSVGRPTFQAFFIAANRLTKPGDIAIIANSDIFFDETIRLVENIKENECYALSRWDVQANGMAIPFHRVDSQDVWIFRTPIKEIPEATFGLGVAGTDNRIAHMLHRAGYKVTNPCKSIHAFHLHLSGVRNYMDKGKVIDRIPPPYKLITPTEL